MDSGVTDAGVTFRIAGVKQEIRPVAAVCLVVICEARFTRGRERHAVRTLDIVAAAFSALRIDTKLI
jgi:hypothetical protein